MSAGAIIVIAVATSGILMMRFRKRWLTKINIVTCQAGTLRKYKDAIAIFQSLFHGDEGNKMQAYRVCAYAAARTNRSGAGVA